MGISPGHGDEPAAAPPETPSDALVGDVPQIAAADPELSVIVPLYNERDNVAPLIGEIDAVLAGRLRFEVVAVDDGSTDGTGPVLAGLAAERSWLRPLTHAANRGQSASLRAGVKAARAPVIAVLDGDGQNDPADIPALFESLIVSGDIDMTVGERRRRHDTWLRRVSSRVANRVRASLLNDGISDSGCSLKVFYRDRFLQLPAFDHMHRFLPALVQLRGGKVLSLPVNHRPRRFGVSKYGVRNRLFTGIVDLLGVMWLQRRRL